MPPAFSSVPPTFLSFPSFPSDPLVLCLIGGLL
jgi:hypothetical protein